MNRIWLPFSTRARGRESSAAGVSDGQFLQDATLTFRNDQGQTLLVREGELNENPTNFSPFLQFEMQMPVVGRTGTRIGRWGSRIGWRSPYPVLPYPSDDANTL